ncbi:Tryptophan synthase beta subunit-like PLP-dependent enzyme [Acididesulfobacillus acetoxydans]|uniref:Threonine synthase n=1 Tax=Acididesulfobacillus acetoxydans TaxID=1561005 RepID=A0A8S0XAP4_9FIRM|nr:2-amino-4-oxopentanoate thiolase subunit OrtB [Acididesulfobacillus acetoxydans]CAA7600196.1 Tryptophan synthase beta subunit-like PLP-dependent enzyme [Acididesulfobacillus acetoxydans]CEJ09574.1 Threonine synthase [Acididesulfobacillus acetoxydans]
MSAGNGYLEVMARKAEIMRQAVGIDYSRFERGKIAFNYDEMMRSVAYSIEETRHIQRETGVGDTPLLELRNLTELARRVAAPGKGARIFVKDEAANPAGSFKARRAALSVYEAVKRGYPGVIAATSGNYGAAVASQAAMRGIPALIVQEVFDSAGRGQPEIVEKSRVCEAYGAEVLQLSVGPELFYVFLQLLEETGFFNASLYTPFGIAGVETLGWELAEQTKNLTGKFPDAVVVTHAGGGNVTGTARGLRKIGCPAPVIGASIDLKGLHMASDHDFNRKSFTTGHTGFGLPFASWPDRSDVPRNAARPLRYLDRYVTVTQGEAFYITEALAQVEGLERGPAGNTSLAAAFALAQELEQDQVVVVQETEYTGAGKHPQAQLTFAREQGIEVRRGDPRSSVPGKNIIIPEHPGQIRAVEVDLDHVRLSYLKNAMARVSRSELTEADWEFLGLETRWSRERLAQELPAAEAVGR